MIHGSVRLYLRVEVVDDGSETKEGKFQRSWEQFKDAAEIPHQLESVHMEPQSCKKSFLFLHTVSLALLKACCLLRGQCRFSHRLTGNCKHEHCPMHGCFHPSRYGAVLTALAEGITALVGTDCKLLSVPAKYSKLGHCCPILLRNCISSSLPKSLSPDILVCGILFLMHCS